MYPGDAQARGGSRQSQAYRLYREAGLAVRERSKRQGVAVPGRPWINPVAPMKSGFRLRCVGRWQADQVHDNRR
jgi:hypothetical protein